MIGYHIPAIPTLYRGRKYRSRLEARWAAFFDRLGWKHEYEPFDLGAWSPDFLLYGETTLGLPTKALVEVKPISSFDAEVGQKMLDVQLARQDLWDAQLLLLGVAPFWTDRAFGVATLGWCAHEKVFGKEGMGTVVAHTAQFKAFVRYPDRKLVFDFGDWSYPPGGHLTGLDSQFIPGLPHIYAPDLLETPQHREELSNHLMGVWARSSNVVQYQRGGVS